MTSLQTSNFLPDLVDYVDAQTDCPNAALDVLCQVCWCKKLDISTVARPFTLTDETFDHLGHVANLYTRGFERTVVFPCGHLFGDRCIGEKLVEERNLACPSCKFQMVYTSCGHMIAPILIPVNGTDIIRDTFPLTIPEGGRAPHNCKECRWKDIQIKLRYALNSRCVICAQKTRAGVPQDTIEHVVHRTQHLEHGVKEVISQLMSLIQPDFLTRHTKTSAEKVAAEADRRVVNASLLNAMVQTELDGTIWYGTATREGLAAHVVIYLRYE
ncbi:hypothetical protein F5Y19DRAFT_479824 [Xylariaceae sp. FL1651]|nr:hypothetical protein F5Y19DRAFT_479824 [Xylariaceae sp. FL1651]